MIKENQMFYNRIQVLIDALVIVLSYVLAWFIKFKSGLMENVGDRLHVEVYFAVLAVILPALLLLYYAMNLYTSKRVQGRRLEAGNVFKANTLGLLVFLAVLYVIRMVDFSRHVVFIFYGINLCLDVLVRNIIRYGQKKMWEKGYNRRTIILIGYSRAAEQYIDRILANPQWGYVARAILDDNIERGTLYRGVKVVGRIDNLPVILPTTHLDEIAITLSLNEYDKLERIVALCEKSGVHTKFIPDYSNIIPTKPYTEDLIGLPVINIRYVPLSNTFYRMIKRGMDIVGSLGAIVLFSPVLLITAILVKSTSKGPLIYSQERVGLHNGPFTMYKFRSMEEQPAEQEKKAWTVKNDPRVTKIGRIIRQTSIDELPQLFNVLRGDMSLVGPRPERPLFVEKFREEIPRYMVKHQVRPGMTGWAQVNGYRGNTSIRKRIEYDLYYIENWTIGLDVKILLLTVFKGFIHENAI